MMLKAWDLFRARGEIMEADGQDAAREGDEAYLMRMLYGMIFTW